LHDAIKELAKAVIIAFIAALLIINFVFEIVKVEGKSMEPTLYDGYRLIIEKVTYNFSDPEIGDILVIKYPADTREKFIKRVVAVGGDKVKIEDNKLYVNDKRIDEAYIKEQKMEDFNEKIVPKDTVFILGDNRNYSKDSRASDVGFVNLKLVVGRAVFIIHPFNNIGKVR
jgi:signal peptidase I